ncbi:hypothetical protein P879_05136 [Paragonimus westermani]|uniref:Rab-GAP TBC domain-containing protein n=1 Tax=Paragonimus westermani TaxID=34504 RepID=A0A8T0CZI9_9TREM|nr:hypothetical protein P879_05136 [Paragonimus westermani]
MCIHCTSLPLQNDFHGSDLRQWKNVYVTHIVDFKEYPGIGLKGTLFLTEHETKLLIHWVPDPDQDDSLPSNLRKGYEIDVRDLKHLICRRLPGFRYRALYLVLKNNNNYGPFEFRTGGATEFIKTLGEAAILTRSENDKTLYHIRPRPPQPFTSLYQLPSTSSQGKPKSIPEAGILGNNALYEVGASLRQMSKKVSAPLNTFLDTILTPSQGVVAGERLDMVGTGYNNPYFGYSQNSASSERLRTTEDNDFAVVDVRPTPIPLPDIPSVRRSDPLGVDQWKRHLDPYGRVTCVEKLRKTIFEGGVSSVLRPLLWKYLLGYYLWDNTAEENEKRRVEKHREYHALKKFWKEMSHDRLVRFSLFRDRKCYIDKDVPRTDRKTAFFRDDSGGNLTRLYDILITYTIYNMDFGYFQGMNDLLALILYVIQQEEDAFWCFVGLMERLESNFDGNLNAVREQFYQLFELVEVLDPDFSDYLELSFVFSSSFLQAIWSEHLTKNFHIFFAASVLLMQRHIIMERNYDANCILKHVNDLSFNIPLEPALNCATGYFQQLDQVSNSLPKSVRAILEGPSLSTSIHAACQRGTSASGETSPRIDYTWGLLNDELEDLMANEEEQDADSIASPPSLMIPIPHSSPPPQEFGASSTDQRNPPTVTKPL